MHRDSLKAIKQFFSKFPSLSPYKITQKSLSDGYIFMQFLSLIDCQHFDTSELSKPLVQIEKQYQRLLVFGRLGNQAKQLDLTSKMKNWKLMIRKIKQYFHDHQDKGIKYSDVDLVDLCKNSTVDEISKLFQLVLCVVANCDNKDEFISKMMQLQQGNQAILAGMMQSALETRICSLQIQQRIDLIEQLQLKQQQISSLYAQVTRLQHLNTQYLQKLQEYQKSANQLEYQKQKLRRFNKRNSLLMDNINCSFSLLEKEDFCQYELSQDSQLIMEDSVTYPRGTHNHIVESLKNKLLREEEEHQNEVQQLHQQICQLQEQLKEKTHFEELLVIYQEKYQEALAYVEKVTQYEKEKNKIYQEIIEKDIIIEELKITIAQNNQRLLEVEEEKIDLQLLLAKKNNQKLTKHSFDKGKSQHPTNEKQSLYKTNLPTVKKHQTTADPKLSLTHNRQISQQVPRLHSRISLTLYPYQQDEDSQNIRLEELQIKTESQSLEIKRLQRKEKELTKHNTELKTKLQKMRKIENENKKLSSIIVELQTRKNEQTEILVSCLHETVIEYDFKFHKLIGGNCLNTQAEKILKKSSSQTQKFTQISNLPSRSYRMSAFNTTFSSENSPFNNKKKDKRNPSIRVQSQSDKQLIEGSVNKEQTVQHLQ